MHLFRDISFVAVVCVATMTPLPLAAQFQGLTTNGDGSVLYFSSPIRQRGTNQTFHYKIFRWDAAGGIRVAAEVASEGQSDGCVTDSFYQLQSPQVSSDGTVLAYTASRPGASGRFCSPVETNQGVVELPGRKVRLDGTVALSLNGRYAVTTPLAAVNSNFHIVTDLAAGVSSAIAGAFNGSGQRVTDDATVATTEPMALILSDRNGGTLVIQTKYAVDDAIIDRSGKTLVYVTNLAPDPGGAVEPGRISSIDLASGRETQLITGFAPGNPTLTSDGATLFFTDINLIGPGHQLYAIGTGGAGLRQVTNESDQVPGATVSGDGLVAYGVTGGSRLIRIDVASGKSTELAAAPPFLGAAYLGFPPATTVAPVGSVVTILGSGLANARQLTFRGQPVAILSATAGQVKFQVPWNTPEGACQVVVQTDSPFEHGITLQVETLDPQFVVPAAFLIHQDSSGPITESAPAKPGEVMAAYMTGLGPLDNGGLLTTAGFVCRFDGVPATVSYAGAAPGFTGFYQVNVAVPNLAPHSATLSCGWDASAVFAFAPVWIG